MDIIFEISASNYTGWQKFHPKRSEPAQIFNHFLSRSSGPIGVKTELGPLGGARFARRGRFAPAPKKKLSTDSVSAAQGELSLR